MPVSRLLKSIASTCIQGSHSYSFVNSIGKSTLSLLTITHCGTAGLLKNQRWIPKPNRMKWLTIAEDAPPKHAHNLSSEPVPK